MPSPRVKSVFILPFLIMQMVLFVISCIQLWAQGLALPWIAPLLSSTVFLLAIGYIATSGKARTSANLHALVGLSGLAIFLAVLGFQLNPEIGGSALLYTCLSGLGSMAYVFWYSRLGRDHNPALDPGQPLMKFTLENLAGEKVTSEDLVGKPTIYLFYRGSWCPICVAQVKEIAEKYRDLKERGARVALISPQPEKTTLDLSKRFDAPMDFFVDPKSHAATKLGIIHPYGLPFGMQPLGYDEHTVYPTVIITDAEGMILFSDQTDNYRVRPEPDTYLRVLDEHGAMP
jgi:peroxiredoxin